MYKKTYNIEIDITLEQMEMLENAYHYQDERQGLFDNFDEYIEDKIQFRLLRHIFDNVQLEFDLMRHYNCEQT